MDLSKRLKFIPTYRYHPETLTYRDNVLNTAETISERSLQHVDKFVRDCKEAGIWNFLIEVMPFAGIGINAGLTKLKYQTTIYATATNFIAADFSEATGLTGDGSTKYLNLNFLANNLPAGCHISFYQRTDAVSGARVCVGANDANDDLFVGSSNVSVDSQTRLGKATIAQSSAQMVKGFYFAERSSPTSLVLYRNNTSIATSAVNTVFAAPALNLYGFARNNNGAVDRYHNVAGSFISVGQAMTAQQRADYYSIVQTLQVNLGRAV